MAKNYQFYSPDAEAQEGYKYGTKLLKQYHSDEITGDGQDQSTAHNLGVAPDTVIVVPTDGGTVVEGTHTSTNVIVNCTNQKKYKFIAFVRA